MDVSVVVAGREDKSRPTDAVAVAATADRLGYRELWVGESGPTWDGFALAAAIGSATEQIAITVGPVPVSVRDAATIARGAESVAALTGRPVGVALGTSSGRVVRGLHGRSRGGAATLLESTAAAIAPALTGGLGADLPEGDLVVQAGFRRRHAPAGGSLSVAAFGDRALATAAAHADRVLIDTVSPEQVSAFRSRLDDAAARSGRPTPRLAAWLPAALAPDSRSVTQLLDHVTGYLAVPGYAEMFTAAGFGDEVARAASGAPRDELVNALPLEAVQALGVVGDHETIRGRLLAYEQAGLDEIGLVPATAGDAAAEQTLSAFATSNDK
ncbi:LLM class F420-dependent oxidoreductase [Saccharopolyspora dendranthemae]|uniref:Putative F420-dependent oxidoreductase n=1 Tax=Saccharopolyspora dendranthemae TaxID=1181886 RepID=A0A561U7P5_9PSEU|nr:LLM class F420-dependent oxidoreductase [Saccharopolyspora dendranthemae]TWF95388.1 putative F420-dependent oxidoreductase [Saccharopolyspora dendranthemae]